MRFKDFLITILISTITSLIIVWTLINAGIIQTQHHYFLKQSHSDTLTGIFNETIKSYVIYIEKIHIENVSEEIAIRFLHISLEARILNYDYHEIVDINYLKLTDQNYQIVISEKSLRFAASNAFLTIDTSANPVHAYYISLKVTGTHNFTLTYVLKIIQELVT